jgi:alcohol dehydrogenase class IV
VGVFLPYTIEYIEKAGSERYAEICHFLHLPCEGTADLLKAIHTLQDEINQPKTLSELEIARTDFEKFLPHLVNTALNSIELTASPRTPGPEDLERLFTCAWEGKPVDF